MTTTERKIMNETTSKKEEDMKQLSSSTTTTTTSGSSKNKTNNSSTKFEDKKPENFTSNSSSHGKMVVLADSTSVIYHPSLINKIKKRTLFFIFIPAIPVILIFLCFLLLIDQKVLFDSSSSKPPQPQQSPSSPPPKAPPMIQRLPTTLIPSLYILTLQVFLPYKPGVDFGPLNKTVAGSVIINFQCRQDTDMIVLNAHDILIKNDSLKLGDQDSNKSLNVEMESMNPETQILKLRSYPPMAKGRNYTLLVQYGTRIRSPHERGLFLGSYEQDGEQRYHMVSQMQPIESRKVFPCFDEPSFKARFQINVIHPTGTTAISNTEAVDRLEHKTFRNWTRTEFEISPIMSPYLLAIAITDFGFVETTYRDIKLRIWAQPKYLNDTRPMLNLLPKGLHFYEDYFNISYPLSKLDYYAVQELPIAAMENWGLITIQETAIAHNPEIGSLASYAQIAMTVLHEMAHMWFGNLITMRWWNDLWLNEGFACHMSYKAMRIVTPELDVNFLVQHLTAQVQNMEEKQIQQPLSSNVTTNRGIMDAFNKVNYNKGAAVIHMFESVIGEDVFRLSLQSFIKHHFYDNAVSADFARSIGRTMKHLNSSNPFGKLGITGALKSWTRKPGFPQITVKRINETSVEISQQPYYSPDIIKTVSHFRYTVPLVYTTMDSNDSKLVIINNNETLIINDLAIIDPYADSYFKILYDDETWLRLARQLQENHMSISTKSRARLIHESLGFTFWERLNITISFEMAKYLKNEIEPAPILLFLLHMDNCHYIFYGNDTKVMLKKYISSLLIPIFERVISEEGQKIDEQVKRLTILKLCLLNYQPCIDYVKNVFSQAFKDCKNSILSNPSCNKIDVGYRSTIYAMAVKHGDKDTFEFLWEKYLAETDKGEAENLLQGLVATQDYQLSKRVIEYHIENATHMVNLCVLYYHANSLKQVRPYLINNFPYLLKKTSGKFFGLCLHAIYRFPQKEHLINEVKEFEATNKDAIKAGGPSVAALIRMRKKSNEHDVKVQKLYAQTLNAFLYEYVSTLPTSSSTNY